MTIYIIQDFHIESKKLTGEKKDAGIFWVVKQNSINFLRDKTYSKAQPLFSAEIGSYYLTPTVSKKEGIENFIMVGTHCWYHHKCQLTFDYTVILRYAIIRFR